MHYSSWWADQTRHPSHCILHIRIINQYSEYFQLGHSKIFGYHVEKIMVKVVLNGIDVEGRISEQDEVGVTWKEDIQGVVVSTVERWLSCSQANTQSGGNCRDVRYLEKLIARQRYWQSYYRIMQLNVWVCRVVESQVNRLQFDKLIIQTRTYHYYIRLVCKSYVCYTYYWLLDSRGWQGHQLVYCHQRHKDCGVVGEILDEGHIGGEEEYGCVGDYFEDWSLEGWGLSESGLLLGVDCMAAEDACECPNKHY